MVFLCLWAWPWTLLAGPSHFHSLYMRAEAAFSLTGAAGPRAAMLGLHSGTGHHHRTISIQRITRSPAPTSPGGSRVLIRTGRGRVVTGGVVRIARWREAVRIRRRQWRWRWRRRRARARGPHPRRSPVRHPQPPTASPPRGGWASRTASRPTSATTTSSRSSLATGQYLGECTGHSGTIHEISFSAPSSPQVICSCSSDGTIRAWDTRYFKQISLLRGGTSQEMFSFSFGGSSGNLLAAGSNAQVLLWDWRNSKQLACLEESHMDDVTQVKFAPNQQSKLISAAVDGLVCVFDTDGDVDEDNNLLSVMNVETSVAKVGFYGNMYQKLWCLTHIESLSTWDWNDGSRELNIQDARSLATDRWNLDHVDYFVDCHYSLPDDRLWVIGGTTAGTIGYFPVKNDPPVAIGSAEAILEGGHTGVVRTIYPAASSNQSLGQNMGIFGWTGGEDGRLCCWRSAEIAEINNSWISGSLVSRLQKRTKSRHQPY